MKEYDLRHLNSVVRFLAAISILSFSMSDAGAQDSARSGHVYDELARMDRQLFDAAFVDCDQAKFSSIFTDDAEFYHDRTGADYGESVRQLRSCPRDNGVKRTLVPGSLEVYPIKDFGAIQMGRHTFTREGEQGAEIARFIHLWSYSDGSWRLSRVMSFDHRPMTEQD
ncbi:MAG: nuclear transport factor 2 family protein [Steroidobacteraceae bacterium]